MILAVGFVLSSNIEKSQVVFLVIICCLFGLSFPRKMRVGIKFIVDFPELMMSFAVSYREPSGNFREKNTLNLFCYKKNNK